MTRAFGRPNARGLNVIWLTSRGALHNVSAGQATAETGGNDRPGSLRRCSGARVADSGLKVSSCSASTAVHWLRPGQETETSGAPASIWVAAGRLVVPGVNVRTRPGP